MSYQVLARKWRPRNFEGLVGQEHVVRALTHALEQQRLHHAYLFTGTRGVGKTTIARILAKSLNCERGVTATPCGVCGACTEIDSGRFVDLLEVDAATNTRVDEMRALLENAVYAPTRGRYKVYVIDEVHMLSNSAFNAMLKTLEEPPEHVKFILATTDPQKIPVTVLSRCLQFNLKQMPQEAVVRHLTKILDQESIAYDLPSLRLVARAGAGSMRDALSLLDQAIAHGAGKVAELEVREMLGTVDADQVLSLLEALPGDDVPALMRIVEAMTVRSLSFDGALQELASLLVRIQVAQFAPESIPEDDPCRNRIVDLAGRLDAEFVQLAYQIVVQGRQDLPYAPEAVAGFTMTLLRLHAFRPRDGASSARSAISARAPVVAPAVALVSPPPVANAPRGEPSARAESSTRAESSNIAAPGPEKGGDAPAIAAFGDWREVVHKLRLGGMVRELAQHCEWRGIDAGVASLCLAPAHRHLLVKASQDKLQQALSDYAGLALRLEIKLADPAGETPASRDQRERRAKQDNAIAAIEGDGFVREVIDMFDATLIDSSIKPIS